MSEPAIQALLQEGNRLQQRGAFDEAARRYERALSTDPARIDALLLLAMVLLQQNRVAEARPHVEKVLMLAPDNAAAHNLHGAVHMHDGHPEEALAAFERASTLEPGFANAWLSHALAAMTLGRFEPALTSLDRLIALQPDHATAFLHRAKALIALGRRAEAIAPLERALALKPDLAEAHMVMGNVLLELERAAEARVHHERAVALMPARADAHMNFASSLLAVQQPHDAIRHYERAIALNPGSADARINLAMVQLRLERPAEALPHLEHALTLKPDSALALEHLGNAQRLLGDSAAALASYDKAIAADPRYASAYDTKGKYLIELGRLDEARELIGKAIELDPHNAGYLQTIARLKDLTPDDPHFTALEALARDADALKPEEQLELHFALGKAYGDAKQHERAFHHMRLANALKRQETKYDEELTLRRLSDACTVFSAEFLRDRPGNGDASRVPVFIVGIPRSGSTLIEQILASHPRIHGAGERPDFERTFNQVAAKYGQPYPTVASALTDHDLRKIGKDYVAGLRTSAPTADRIVDKMLGNFVYVGLIRLVLPNARIIHARRNPIDTCVSCFSLRFAAEMPFLYDLGELGRYYRAYEALMAHWREVVPPEVMIEVQYEDVVDDLEGQARRIVAHCGLEWDDACLAFHETKRLVRTASAAQVRRPIYHNSVERWRPYKDQLEPLFEALGLSPD